MFPEFFCPSVNYFFVLLVGIVKTKQADLSFERKKDLSLYFSLHYIYLTLVMHIYQFEPPRWIKQANIYSKIC